MSLDELATALSSVEDWLRQDCEARHAEEMAGWVHEAFRVVDDLADMVERLEGGAHTRRSDGTVPGI